MRLYEFRHKTLDQQLSLIDQYGIKLLERSVGSYQVSLNFMRYFFMEVWLATTSQRVVKLVSYRDQSCIDPVLSFSHPDSESSALVFLALKPDLSLVPLHDSLGDGHT